MFEWHSDNETVATVDDRGYIRCLSEGVATITCVAYNGKIQDRFTIVCMNYYDEYDPPLILNDAYTGILSSENGETISTNSTVSLFLTCADGFDHETGFGFGWCNYGLFVDLMYEGQPFYFSFGKNFKMIPEGTKYTLYGETVLDKYGYDRYPAIISGMLDTKDLSVYLKINLVIMEKPVNLTFRGSINSM
jgi:hypothetical protein